MLHGCDEPLAYALAPMAGVYHQAKEFTPQAGFQEPLLCPVYPANYCSIWPRGDQNELICPLEDAGETLRQSGRCYRIPQLGAQRRHRVRVLEVGVAHLDDPVLRESSWFRSAR